MQKSTKLSLHTKKIMKKQIKKYGAAIFADMRIKIPITAANPAAKKEVRCVSPSAAFIIVGGAFMSVPMLILIIIIAAAVVLAVKKRLFGRRKSNVSRKTQTTPVSEAARQQEQPKQKVQCPHCGRENKAGSYFCEHCGEKI